MHAKEMTDIEEHDREMIETMLGRALTQAELQPVGTPEAMSAEQREVVKRLAAMQHVLCVLYVKAIANVSVARATGLIDQVTHVGIPSRSAPWGRDTGMGRWNFVLPQTDSIGRVVKVLLENLRPFSTLHVLELLTEGVSDVVSAVEVDSMELPHVLDQQARIRLVLDLLIEESDGHVRAVERAGMIELRLQPDTGELDLSVSVEIDIYASVTWQHRDNEALALQNAPRLARFITLLERQLHACFVSSEGNLETTESGFR